MMMLQFWSIHAWLDHKDPSCQPPTENPVFVLLPISKLLVVTKAGNSYCELAFKAARTRLLVVVMLPLSRLHHCNWSGFSHQGNVFP